MTRTQSITEPGWFIELFWPIRPLVG